MKQIPLTDGKFATVDDEDFDELMKVKWQFHLGYASRQKTIGPSQRRRRAMHREILGLADPVIQVDHINGDRLDNRKMNLRLCTVSQNNRNRRVQSNNRTGLKGIYKMKHCERWRAEIFFEGKRKSLGRFKSPDEAYAAYCEAAKELHGEFANFGRAALLAASMGGDRT